jgi:uncharacterized protein (DUF1684 family)
MRLIVAALAFFSVVSLTGCSAKYDGDMPAVPLPPVYVVQLDDHRAVRDDYFESDPNSPLLASARDGFTGLEYFNADETLYFVGDAHFYTSPEQLVMTTTGGAQREALRVGWVGFKIGGERYRLQVYQLLDGEGGLFLPFQDATTGDETYPAGRYINLLPQSPRGPYVLDFNRAYNPSCAYGEPERFACPVTPAENRLDIAIRAGERGAEQAES